MRSLDILWALPLCAMAAWGAQTPAPDAQTPPESPAQAPQFDPSQYPLSTLAKADLDGSCRGSKVKYLVKDRLFSAELVYQGTLRPTPPGHYELMRRWTKSVGDPEALVKYKQEVSLAEGKKVHWMPVPEGLVGDLQGYLQAGDRALVYAILIGCVQGRALFAIDEFENYSPEDEEADDYITLKGTSRNGKSL
ncbi:MAG: hypothetical protein AAB576_00500 [Elusimicrobiota bacterium]